MAEECDPKGERTLGVLTSVLDLIKHRNFYDLELPPKDKDSDVRESMSNGLKHRKFCSFHYLPTTKTPIYTKACPIGWIITALQFLGESRPITPLPPADVLIEAQDPFLPLRLRGRSSSACLLESQLI